MNRTIRNLIVALPLTAAALTITPGAAMADHLPSGPGDITAPTPGPIGPGDIANPEPGPTQPTGPGDLTAPQPCPTHGVCGGHGDNGGSGNGSSGNEGNGGGGHQGSGHHGSQGGNQVASIALPTRVDAGLAPAAQDRQEDGLELSWLLASGALVTISGAAFAARKRAARRA